MLRGPRSFEKPTSEDALPGSRAGLRHTPPLGRDATTPLERRVLNFSGRPLRAKQKTGHIDLLQANLKKVPSKKTPSPIDPMRPKTTLEGLEQIPRSSSKTRLARGFRPEGVRLYLLLRLENCEIPGSRYSPFEHNPSITSEASADLSDGQLGAFWYRNFGAPHTNCNGG